MENTEQHKLVELLESFGVSYEVGCDRGGNATVTVEQGASLTGRPDNKITGYNGFMTIFSFTAAGKFINMGAWE